MYIKHQVMMEMTKSILEKIIMLFMVLVVMDTILSMEQIIQLKSKFSVTWISQMRMVRPQQEEEKIKFLEAITTQVLF